MQRAKSSFFANVEGQPERSIVKGDLLADNDPYIKGREHLFEDVELAVAPVRHSSPVQTKPKAEKVKADKPDVDQAPAKKAAPAKRTSRRAAKKAAKAPAKKAASAAPDAS